jgi:hypothetical protein
MVGFINLAVTEELRGSKAVRGASLSEQAWPAPRSPTRCRRKLPKRPDPDGKPGFLGEEQARLTMPAGPGEAEPLGTDLHRQPRALVRSMCGVYAWTGSQPGAAAMGTDIFREESNGYATPASAMIALPADRRRPAIAAFSAKPRPRVLIRFSVPLASSTAPCPPPGRLWRVTHKAHIHSSIRGQQAAGLYKPVAQPNRARQTASNRLRSKSGWIRLV